MRPLRNIIQYDEDTGFTFVETLVTMIIMVLVSTSILVLVTIGWKSSIKIRKSIVVTHESIIKDEFLRKWGQDIHLMPWESMSSYLANNLETIINNDYFKDKIRSVKYLYDSDKIIVGMQIEYYLSDGTIQKTSFLFGSRTVM